LLSAAAVEPAVLVLEGAACPRRARGNGVTNRDMASTLFISPKTMAANLTRIYRKLNIPSRAALGRIMGQFDSWGNTRFGRAAPQPRVAR
jgi:hypothetical protein